MPRTAAAWESRTPTRKKAPAHRSMAQAGPLAMPVSDRPAEPRSRAVLQAVFGWLRSIPVEAILVGLGLFAVLAIFVAADPPSNATYSQAPFTDEAFNVVNSRNLVQLGQWSTDQWTRQFVELPFSLLEAATFQLIGVGIVQARLPMILCVSLTASALVWGLRDLVGRSCAIFAGLAFAGSGLILLYGRLVFFEDLVVLGLTLGTLVLVREGRLTLRGGLLSGACYATAIGTKPNAAFAVLGILVAVGAAWGWRDRGIRRWLAGTGLVVCISGLGWAVFIWLPNQAAVAIDFATWPALQFALTPQALLESVRLYLQGGSDDVVGSLLGPLLAFAALGVVAIIVLRGRLSGTEARLAVAAGGWAVFGFGILLIVSYRPNRYAVPLVPALAILAAIGLHVGGGWLAERLESRRAVAGRADGDRSADRSVAAAIAQTQNPRGSSLGKRRAIPLLAALAVLIAVAPGLRLYGSWAGSATYNLVSIQDRFASLVPAGERVAGRDAALFLMKSPAITIIVGLANNGDLYAEGVRMYLVLDGDPVPTGVPAGAWAARQSIACADWNSVSECLVRVP